MTIPFLDSLNRLGVVGYILFGVIGVLMIYLTFTNRIHIMFSLIVLSAAFVGSSISMLDGLASVSRWVTIFLLFLLGVLKSRMKVSVGMLLYWVYVLFGILSLFFAVSFSWQIQRSVLLIVVTLGISLAYGDKPLATYQSTLMWIGMSAAIFAIVNILFLPGQLNDPTRFSGLAKAAPAFAMALGGMLPFMFYGFLQAKSSLLKIIYGLGFVAGAITLIFTGQRAGTLAGIVGLLPLLVVIWRKKNFFWFLLVFIGAILVAQVFLEQTSLARLNFLISRYSLSAGLSGRSQIWDMAFSEISRSPILGHGIGAAEQVISSSFHNTYLEVWYNTGLPGLFFFVSAQLYFFFRLLVSLGNARDSEQLTILALAFGYFIGFLELCIFESVGAGASNVNIVLYIFLGVLVSNPAFFKSVAKTNPVEDRGSVAVPTP